MEAPPIINYDYFFNANEWFILVILIVGYGLVLLLPKKFPLPYTILFLLIGLNSSILFDHSISIPPFDFYDVNDSSYFEIFDFLSYIMFGPFAYFFFYFYEKWSMKGYFTMLYLIVWSILSMAMEGMGTYLGMFHYKNGYTFMYSFPIYFYVESFTLWLYILIMKNAPPGTVGGAK